MQEIQMWRRRITMSSTYTTTKNLFILGFLIIFVTRIPSSRVEAGPPPPFITPEFAIPEDVAENEEICFNDDDDDSTDDSPRVKTRRSPLFRQRRNWGINNNFLKRDPPPPPPPLQTTPPCPVPGTEPLVVKRWSISTFGTIKFLPH
jgi:hypothetical protein